MTLTKQKACPRETYGRALLAAAERDQRVVALDADLSASTMSCLVRQSFPERFFEMGIAEQNMVAVGAGLSLTGKIPFVHSFSMFVSGRAFEQVRQSVALPKANVKLVGSSYGFSDFGDGATHQSLEDAAIMRAIPNMTVLIPGDPKEVEEAVALALAVEGPVYIRISRSEMPFLPDSSSAATGLAPVLVADGTDVAVIANGLMVEAALQAREMLQGEGLSLRVINVPSLKPFHSSELMQLVQGCQGIVTAEEHSIVGGLGSAVLEAFAGQPLPLRMVGVADQFGQSASSHEELLTHYGLTSADIAAKAREVAGR